MAVSEVDRSCSTASLNDGMRIFCRYLFKDFSLQMIDVVVKSSPGQHKSQSTSMTKITFRIPATLWASFTIQTQKLFINRGPFLDHILAIELPYIDSELENYRMSAKARRYVSGLLAHQSPKIVNIEIQDTTAELLDKVVKQHCLLRDALLCRLVIFIRGSDALFKYLDMPKKVNGLDTGYESLSTSPLKAIEEVYSDPLYYVRCYLNDSHDWKCGIYKCPMPKRWDWAACYLEDINVPGTKAHKVLADELASVAAEFELNEIDLFFYEQSNSEIKLKTLSGVKS